MRNDRESDRTSGSDTAAAGGRSSSPWRLRFAAVTGLCLLVLATALLRDEASDDAPSPAAAPIAVAPDSDRNGSPRAIPEIEPLAGIEREAIASPDASSPAPGKTTPLATLTIHVFDGITRQPRNDFSLRCSAGPFTADPTSDATGMFVVNDIPVPSRLLCILRTAKGSVVNRTVDIAAPGPSAVDFWVEPLARLSGRTIDHGTQQPIAGATIELWGGGLKSTVWSQVILASTRTAADGRFSLEFVADAADVRPRLCATADGYCKAMLRAEQLDGVEVSMLVGATLEGLVVDDHGQPLPDVEFHVRCSDKIDPSSVGLSLQEIGELVLIPQQGMTDVAGRFRTTGLLPHQEHSITIVDPAIGYFSDEAQRVLTTLGAAGSVTTVRIEKRSLDNPGSIEGVLRYNGKPAPLPFTYMRGSTRREGKADASGKYRLDDVPAGGGRLSASIPGIASSSSDVVVPSGGVVTLDLEVKTEMSLVRGKVVTPTGEPLAGLDLAVRGKVKDWGIGIRTNAQGEFTTMTAIAPGDPVVLRIQHGAELVTQDARGGDEAITIVLEPLSRVLLRIVATGTRLPVPAFEIRTRRVGESTWNLLGTKFKRLPNELTEIELSPGAIEIEVDHDRRFYAPTRILALAKPDPEPLWIEIERAVTGIVRIEYVREGAELEVPGAFLYYRVAGSSENFASLGSGAHVRSGDGFGEYALPIGRFELGFANFNDPPSATTTLTVEAGDEPRTLLRVRLPERRSR